MIIQDSLTADVLVAGRLARGTVRESRRVVHVFEVDAGGSGAEVRTRCGESLPRAHVEWLAPGVGMPCESCLGLAGADLPRSPLSELGV
ncbi:hypothetical protein [Amycolatopsis sp. FDAARGOS 1241]|uniref:hypothetical protein n=1 Tax=Amycolatopsis sp. FDAARGOS 1241 TaxID=2778070 RepID=UPI001951040F|nr:hypothetical protein [Amycolatopsis sp. FDAARGOS 1241]QRP45583.1 hypothetical protein I6J71_41800 [Amycolatopsis sp. FDAARGOS 1241]